VCSLSVTSDEGQGGGSGHSSPDWEVLSTHEVNLRAERMGTGTGRDYFVAIDCADALALTSSASVTVSIPHDSRRLQQPARQR